MKGSRNGGRVKSDALELAAEFVKCEATQAKRRRGVKRGKGSSVKEAEEARVSEIQVANLEIKLAH